LTHSELEKIKSTFEREKALKYDATRPSEEAKRLTNLDSSIRTKQQKRAEE
jgi:replication fork clamp-binding protein CrfC